DVCPPVGAPAQCRAPERARGSGQRRRQGLWHGQRVVVLRARRQTVPARPGAAGLLPGQRREEQQPHARGSLQASLWTRRASAEGDRRMARRTAFHLATTLAGLSVLPSDAAAPPPAIGTVARGSRL